MSFAGSGGQDQPLPWGWWLRVVDGRLHDPDGNTWSSVREAFWRGRLGFPETHVAPEQHEQLLRVLLSLDRPYGDGVERAHDLFDGDMANWRFYMCWLHSVGLTMPTQGRWEFSASLSDEGRSVLAMLQATREPGHAVLSFKAVLEAVRGARRTRADEDREQSLRSFERGIVRLHFLFAREELAGRPVVTLTGFGDGRMPLRRVIWSQSFADKDVRDDFFGWLAHRVDRWEDWGALAYRKGADALTSHLLGLVALVLAPTASSS